MKDKTIRRILTDHLVALDGGAGNNLEAHLIYGLTALANNQSKVSLPVPGAVPALGQEPTKDVLRTYSLALMVELAEFVQTLNWKPWKKDQPIDREKVTDEFADVLAFFGVLLMQLFAMGFTANDLATAYRRKSKINMRRFLGEQGAEYGLVEEEKDVQLELFKRGAER